MTKKILINVNQNLLNATVMVIAMTICAMVMENVFCSRKRLKKVVYVIFLMRENFVRVHGLASTMKGLVKRLGNEIFKSDDRSFFRNFNPQKSTKNRV